MANSPASRILDALSTAGVTEDQAASALGMTRSRTRAAVLVTELALATLAAALPEARLGTSAWPLPHQATRLARPPRRRPSRAAPTTPALMAGLRWDGLGQSWRRQLLSPTSPLITDFRW